MRIIAGLLVAALTVPGMAQAQKADPIAASLQRLRKGAKCDDKASPWRPWCIAASWSTGTASQLPAGKILVGLTVQLEDATDIATALTKRTSFVALAIDADGKVKLTDVKADGGDELKAVLEAVANVSIVFKGKAKTAKIPAVLGDYLKTLAGAYATTKSGDQWTWQGKTASQLRKVGAFWVVLERPATNDGIFATILTDAWE